ncbi:1-phosphatidylinositol 4-5-bisphosphate phosphodiesterase 1 [Apiospora arundinis]
MEELESSTSSKDVKSKLKNKAKKVSKKMLKAITDVKKAFKISKYYIESKIWSVDTDSDDSEIIDTAFVTPPSVEALGPPSPVIPPSEEVGGILYRLPQEMRDEVYAYVFGSTRLWFGAPCRGLPARRSERHSLALLRVCRRIRAEIGNSWVKYILLHFDAPEIMLQKLLTIPAPIDLVRYIRVAGLLGTLPNSRSPLAMSHQPHLFIHEFMRVLEGLQLAELTVIANTGHLTHEYQAVEFLLRTSNGWKRLVVWFWASHLLDTNPVASPDWYWFAYRYGLEDHYRGELPRAFRSVLRHRDGAHTRPMVHMIQGDPGDVPSMAIESITNAQLRALYQQRSQTPLSVLASHRQLVIIAERGRGVGYTVNRLRDDEERHQPYLVARDLILTSTRDVYDNPHGFQFSETSMLRNWP